jgi:hypothetical protein
MTPRIASGEAETFSLTRKQNEVLGLLRDPAKRYIKLVGGSRSTKTSLLVRQIIGRAVHFAGSRHVSLRLHHVDAYKSLWLDTIPKVMSKFFVGLGVEHGNVRKVNARGETRLQFWNGSEYWIGGLDDKERVDKILGLEFATIHPNEVSQIPYVTILKTRTRLAQQVFDEKQASSENPNGKLIQKEFDDLNPVGKSHWSYVEFDLGMNPMELARKLERFICLKHDEVISVDPGRCPQCGEELSNIYGHSRMNPRDNPFLDRAYIRSLEAMPLAMRLRFLEGLDQDELEGAMWNLEAIARARQEVINPPEWPFQVRRIVIGVDPSGTGEDDVGGGDHDNIGIVVCAKDVYDRGLVLEDATLNGPPATWAAKVKEMRIKWGADLVVAEGNYGGAMVIEVLRHADPNCPVELVNASRGKAVRAEPVSLLYSRDGGLKMVHCGEFPKLEEEMCSIKQGDTVIDIKKRLGRSPGSLDALCWAFTKLFDLSSAEVLMKFYEKQAAEDAATPQIPAAGVVVPFSDTALIQQPTLEEIDKFDSVLRL